MNYAEAMATAQKKDWEASVNKEYRRMEEMGVWKVMDKEDIPKDAKVLTSTWAMKQKASGVKRARLVGHGFKQVDGVHFDGTNIASPVTNDMSVRIVMVLALMAGWTHRIVDIKGAFLHGEFDEGTPDVYMEIPDGMKKIYPSTAVLLLKKTIYGLKNASKAFWRELLAAMKSMGFARNHADPCLYYKWDDEKGLVVWQSWIDDCLSSGPKELVDAACEELMTLFKCEDEGTMEEYVGCKIERNAEEGWARFSQPVMIQSFKDEFDFSKEKSSVTPGEPGKVLVKNEQEEATVGKEGHSYFRKAIGKLLHMMRWSRPEIQNAVRDCSRHLKNPMAVHLKAANRIMRYVHETPKRGWYLKPTRKWDGKDMREHGSIGQIIMLKGRQCGLKNTGQKFVQLS